MDEKKDEVKDAPQSEKMVLVFHSGEAHGPMDTAYGRLVPGQSLALPKSIADKLVGAYKHLKYASDIIPGVGVKAAELAAGEKAKLEGLIKSLEAKLADVGADVDTRVSAAVSEKQEEIAKLKQALDEFLQAKDKKALEALQDKHAVAP